ncbi:hypothetical protein H0E84_07495 [Luteimonas sp. SJ-92]|uniref:Uncharacterized protein n=1 Tax=Luteimonas salinisoli TaxID=2752307 RepID=A0A853JC87_9GAMM|nr:hypothetical protein [Luteimonas salinisoli]NZA26228.1 hypothetical protein [Luteimonas salinisoli]
MKKLIMLAVALAFSQPAQACQCAFPPLDTQSVREAKNVFVFRLLDARLQTEGSALPLTATVLGNIEIVDTIRGTADAKRIRYSVHQCCGTRLDVGKYYLALSSDSGPEIHGHSGNLIEAGEMYYPGSGTRERIETVLSGEEGLENAFSAYALDRTQQIPRPPPPNCPGSGAPTTP